MKLDPKLSQITGRFVLCSESGQYTFDDDCEILKHPDGTMVLSNAETVYFEEDLGEGKAKYWTKNLNEAHVFTNIDDAVAMFLATKTSQVLTVIRQVSHQQESITALNATGTN